MSNQVSASDAASELGTAGQAPAVGAAFGRRLAPARDLVDHAGDIVAAAQAMAGRFRAGGKLLTFGIGAASTDAQHVAVEFVHPVIVGKRALPAISLTSDVAAVTAIAAGAGFGEVFAHQLRKLAGPADMALSISVDGIPPSVLFGLQAARAAGLLTVVLTAPERTAGARFADHLFAARSEDPCVIKEIHVTIYHLLWELVHVFLEQPPELRGGSAGHVG